MPPTERHLPFFRLLDAVRQPGCPLCRLARTHTRRRLESILYEAVNDTGFRDQWRAARGYCRRHAWILAEFQDALGTAILYEDLIASFGERLLTEGAGRDCPLCRAEATDLHDRLALLEQSWDDDELRSAVEASDGLCGPHLRVLLRRARRADVRAAVLRVSAAHLRRLAAELRQQIESCDYQHAPPRDERIRFAWRRAIEQLVGYRDVAPMD